MSSPRVLPAGDRAWLVELPHADTRRLADAALRANPPAGLVDQVPAALTVLLRFATPEAAAAALPGLRRLDWEHAAAADTTADEVVVPTLYDGDDLADVAALLGMEPEQLIAWHTGRTWSVEFGGFLPGFGYLVAEGGETDAIEVPRRPSPRTRVPAGSVALAGPWTAVYPQASPGGWQLIGRTNLPVWDVDRDPPALFTPGRRVRFQQVSELPAPAAPAASVPEESPALTVLHPGALSLVEDLGRPGHGALGVPTGGAADRSAHRLANRLVGNAEDAATLECLLGGLRVRAERDLVVALAGAPAHASVDGRAVAHAQPVHLSAGSVLELGRPDHGLRTHLAVRGGIRVGQPLFGSFSSDPTTGLGPAPLAAGASLAMGDDPQTIVPPPTALAATTHAWGDVTLRVLPGPADDWFTDAGLQTLLTTPWQVTSHSDRVGVRLQAPDGRTIERAIPGERPSEGVVRGAIQVPASGEPLVFLADHPTTGGYPVIACVLDADTDALAQCRPGDTVRFTIAR